MALRHGSKLTFWVMFEGFIHIGRN